jgi:hypothetical protein
MEEVQHGCIEVFFEPLRGVANLTRGHRRKDKTLRWSATPFEVELLGSR